MYELPGHLKRLLRYHYDRRLRVYDFLNGFDTTELDLDLRVGHRSFRILLLHCLEAEQHWIRQVAQGAPFAGIEEADYPDLATIRQLAQQVQQETEKFLAWTTDDDWVATYTKTFRDGSKTESTLEEILLHIITHDTHHRGQVLALSRQLGHTPPDIDFL